MSTAEVSSTRLDGVGTELFVYGTLQFGPVLQELLGRIPEMEFVVARDWRVAALPGRLYPGLVPQRWRLAGGLVLTGLRPREWRVIDAFEDPEYQLRPISLLGRERPVPTFVWTSEAIRNDWVPEVFATDHLERYVARCARWRQQVGIR